MRKIDKSKVFTIEYDDILKKWVVWYKEQNLNVQVGTIRDTQVGNWLMKSKKFEKENKKK